MSDKESEAEADTMPPKSMSQDAVKKLIEEMFESKLEELKRTKGKDREDESDSDEGDTKIEGTYKRIEEIPANQRAFVDALKLVNRDTIDGLPMYSGSVEAEEVIDWIEALNNHFKYKEVPDDKRVKLAMARLKGSALAWWNYEQGERV